MEQTVKTTKFNNVTTPPISKPGNPDDETTTEIATESTTKATTETTTLSTLPTTEFKNFTRGTSTEFPIEPTSNPPVETTTAIATLKPTPKPESSTTLFPTTEKSKPKENKFLLFAILFLVVLITLILCVSAGVIFLLSDKCRS